MSGARHRPVMVARTLALLAPAPGGCFLDCTVGGGGHAAALLECSAPDGRLVGIDRDPAAMEAAAARLAPFGARVQLVRARFDALGRVLDESGLPRLDGVLFDLGASSFQLEEPARGFSFSMDGALDMRMDPDQRTTAAELVKRLPERELADLIFRFGQERRSRRIARAIVAARRRRPLQGTLELAELVARAAGPGSRADRGRIHPATRTFQALRMAVNDELACLEAALPAAIRRLAPGGRMAVLAFHSLEDRAVKLALREARRAGLLELLTEKPLRPEAAEVAENRRARSARLRAAVKRERETVEVGDGRQVR